MAKKIVIAEIDIDMDAVIKNTQALTERVIKLEDETKKLKESEGETSSAYVKSNAELKVAQAELRGHERMTQSVILANKTNAGSLDQLKAELSIVSRQWSALSQEERLNSSVGKELSNRKLKLTEQLKAEESATGDNRRNVGNYTEAIKEASGELKGMIPVTGKAGEAINMFGVLTKVALGPIGLIIALITAIVAALKTFFTSSEEGQDTLAKFGATFKAVWDVIEKILSKIGEILITVITKPKEALDWLKGAVQSIGDFFSNTFGNIIVGVVEGTGARMGKAFAFIGLAWQKMKDIFVDNADGIKKAQNSIAEENKKINESNAKISLGVQNLKQAAVNAYNGIKDAITSANDEFQRTQKIEQEIAERNIKLRKAELADKIADSKEEFKIAELKEEIVKRDKYSGEERLSMLDQVSAMEKDLMKDDLKFAIERKNIHDLEGKARLKDIEWYEKDAELQTAIMNIKTANAEKERGLEKQRMKAVADMEADLQKEAEVAVNTFEYEVEQWKILNRSKLKEAQENNRMLTASDIEAEKERLQKIAELERDGLLKMLEIKTQEIDAKENESEAAKNAQKLKLQEDYINTVLAKGVELNQAKHDLDVSFEEQERQRKIDVAITDYDNQLAIFQNNVLGQLDVQKNYNKLKLQEELRVAEKIGANKELIEKKYQKANLALARAERDAKLGYAQGLAQNIASLAGESTKIGKAAAVAATTIETFRGAQAAFTGMVETFPGPWGIAAGFVAAGVAVAQGIANVKKILAVQPGSTPSGGGESGGSSSVSAPTVTNTLQSANTELGQGIVSRTTETGIQNQQTQLTPTLVIDKVTNAQKVENAKMETATI